MDFHNVYSLQDSPCASDRTEKHKYQDGRWEQIQLHAEASAAASRLCWLVQIHAENVELFFDRSYTAFYTGGEDSRWRNKEESGDGRLGEERSQARIVEFILGTIEAREGNDEE